MRASPSLSQLWQPHSRLCHLCRACERSCSPGFSRKELHATEGAVEVRRARRRLRDTVTDERVGVFTPDKDCDTHTSCGRVAVIAARRGTVCGEVGRVPRFPSTHPPHPLRYNTTSQSHTHTHIFEVRTPIEKRAMSVHTCSHQVRACKQYRAEPPSGGGTHVQYVHSHETHISPPPPDRRPCKSLLKNRYTRRRVARAGRYLRGATSDRGRDFRRQRPRRGLERRRQRALHTMPAGAI